jgi:hypothetical protein
MFRKWQNRRAAKRYAKVLPAWLRRHYGGEDEGRETYTVQQIRKAVSVLKLNPKYIALAYAAYLPEHDYEAVKGELPRQIDFLEARTLFVDYVPVKLQARHSGPRKKRRW